MKIIVRSKPNSQNPISSALLKKIAAHTEQESGYEITKEYNSVADTKGDIITAIIIGVATNILYDMIKEIIKEAIRSAEEHGTPPPEITIDKQEE